MRGLSCTGELILAPFAGLMPRRLMVRLRTLTPSIEVRILTGHPALPNLTRCEAEGLWLLPLPGPDRCVTIGLTHLQWRDAIPWPPDGASFANRIGRRPKIKKFEGGNLLLTINRRKYVKKHVIFADFREIRSPSLTFGGHKPT